MKPIRHPRRRGAAFVLIEVVLALTILGIAVAALMRSFMQSFDAARVMEIQTQAGFLAEQLMEELEVFPPEGEETEAGFGPNYPNFSYQVHKEYIEPSYPRLRRTESEVDQFFAQRRLTITIRYEDEKRAYNVLRVTSAIVGFEKFSANTKRSYAIP